MESGSFSRPKQIKIVLVLLTKLLGLRIASQVTREGGLEGFNCLGRLGIERVLYQLGKSIPEFSFTNTADPLWLVTMYVRNMPYKNLNRLSSYSNAPLDFCP